MERFFVHWAHGLSEGSVIFVSGPSDILDMKRFLIDANHFLTIIACGILLLSCAGHPGRRAAVETLRSAEADLSEFGFIPDADDFYIPLRASSPRRLKRSGRPRPQPNPIGFLNYFCSRRLVNSHLKN